LPGFYRYSRLSLIANPVVYRVSKGPLVDVLEGWGLLGETGRGRFFVANMMMMMSGAAGVLKRRDALRPRTCPPCPRKDPKGGRGLSFDLARLSYLAEPLLITKIAPTVYEDPLVTLNSSIFPR
jgi:hypothetical protein